MDIEFGLLKRRDLKTAAELAARAFEDYEYFTNYFPDKQERQKVLSAIIYREYLTNYGKVHFLTARSNGRLLAVAQINSPDYRKPSDFQYLIHGWLSVYRGVDRKRLDDWLAMDAEAGKPCHDYQKTGTDIWYVSSLTVDPSAQGMGIGGRFIAYWESYILSHGGRQFVLFTNSEKNKAFYLKHGLEVFHTEQFHYEGKTMGSWSMKKDCRTRRCTKDNCNNCRRNAGM